MNLIDPNLDVPDLPGVSKRHRSPFLFAVLVGLILADLGIASGIGYFGWVTYSNRRAASYSQQVIKRQIARQQQRSAQWSAESAAPSR